MVPKGKEVDPKNKQFALKLAFDNSWALVRYSQTIGEKEKKHKDIASYQQFRQNYSNGGGAGGGITYSRNVILPSDNLS